MRMEPCIFTMRLPIPVCTWLYPQSIIGRLLHEHSGRRADYDRICRDAEKANRSKSSTPEITYKTTHMIKLTEKIGYGFGDMASSMFWKLFGAYLMIFYTDVFGLPAAAVGTMFLITRIWDSVFDPIVGVAADRTQTRWGKFRPYLLWLAIPFAAIGVLTFMTPSFGQTGNLIYAYITYSLMMMVYSAINVPYASLLGVMSVATRP